MLKTLDHLKTAIIDEHMVEMLNSLPSFSDGIPLAITKYVFFTFRSLNAFLNLLAISSVLELTRLINLSFKYCKILSKVTCLMNKLHDLILHTLKL